MTETNQRAYLLYDSECGKCTSFMRIAKWFDYRDLIIPVSIQNNFSLDLVSDKIGTEELMSSFHMVAIERTGKRNIASGGDGLIELLKYFPVMRKVATAAESSTFFRDLAKSVYQALARLRRNSCKRS